MISLTESDSSEVKREKGKVDAESTKNQHTDGNGFLCSNIMDELSDLKESLVRGLRGVMTVTEKFS